MTLTKVHFEVLDKAAVDPARGLPASFTAQFNPTEYTRTKSAGYSEIQLGLDSPLLVFTEGGVERLSLELLFDSTEYGTGTRALDVTTLTQRVYQLVKVQPKTHAPPRFRVTWGKGMSFTAVADEVRQRFTLFSPAGVPLRAEVTLGMREYRSYQQLRRDLKLQSPDHSKARVVRRGETLASIAAREYGDPGAWRVIADHNPGVDPRRPRVGTVLAIPPLPLGGRR